MLEECDMANKKKISVSALSIVCQRKFLKILLQNDINKNKELFEKLARL
jgi:hypothetical protein